MFSLTKHILQVEKERRQVLAEKNHDPTQQLIPSPQSPTEINATYDPSVIVLQSNLQNNARPGVQFSNVMQSNDLQDSNQNANISEDEGNINISAALLTVVLYTCSVSLVVYGAIHMKNCPAQNMIAISYIVMGCLMLCSRLLSCPEECRSIFKKESNPQFVPQTLCRLCLNLLLQIATMCFFFAMSYWVFSISPDTKEEGSSNFCEKEFYKTTYYACIVWLSLLGLGFLLLCCAIGIACCLRE